MNPSRYDCSPDVVVDMQNIGVGVEEILQYSSALFTKEEIERLVRGLEEISSRLEAGTFEEREMVESSAP